MVVTHNSQKFINGRIHFIEFFPDIKIRIGGIESNIYFDLVYFNTNTR